MLNYYQVNYFLETDEILDLDSGLTHLIATATNLVSVSLSPAVEGKMAARTRVNRPEVDDRTATTPGRDDDDVGSDEDDMADSDASWYDSLEKKNWGEIVREILTTVRGFS